MNQTIRELPKIAVTGGGTGGHIYPALALFVRAAQEKQCDVFWIGKKGGADGALIESFGIRFYPISTGKLRRYLSIQNIFDVFSIIKGFFQARAVLKREKPALLFSKGGFVSVPPVLAAASLRIPAHTHESDFSPGLATKINARFVRRIWTSYEETAAFFAPRLRAQVRCAGNPVRAAFRNASGEQGRAFIENAAQRKIPSGKKIMLVLGGSQGAEEVNLLIKESLSLLTPHFFIVHQTGSSPVMTNIKEENLFAAAYFNAELPDILAAADIVVGRSGAGTLWESAAAGRPLLLIPLCGSGTRGDQVENAEWFVKAGAALMLIHPSKEMFVKTLTALAADSARLKSCAAASAKIGEKDAARIIIEEISQELNCPLALNG